jgi:plastocyanin
VRPFAAMALLLVMSAHGCAPAQPSARGGDLAGTPDQAGQAATSVDDPSAGSSTLKPAHEGPRINVVAVEYEFRNIPAVLPVGTVLAFENAGDEVHEMNVIRRNPGVTASFEELLHLPPAEADDLLAFVGAPVAEPGRPADATVQLDQPGVYLLICLMPAGMRALPPPGGEPDVLPDAQPHAALGMQLEFTVVP